MFKNVNPSRLRMIGIVLCLIGCGLLLGSLLIFEGLPLTLAVAGALGWLTAAGYAAFGLIGIGTFLLIASFVPRRG